MNGKSLSAIKSFISVGLAAFFLSFAFPAIAEDAAEPEGKQVTLHFFWGDGCPHCAKEKEFLKELKAEFPALEIKDYEVWHNEQNTKILNTVMASTGKQGSPVPVTIIDGKILVGFSEQSKDKIRSLVAVGFGKEPPKVFELEEKEEEEGVVDIPLIGRIDGRKLSLPVFTLVLAGADSFNPCAFFVLLFLLSMLIHLKSRWRMLLVGGTFVFISGFVYFLFMAAWLNLFMLTKKIMLVTLIAGVVALVIGVINIKDYFFFKQGVSLAIPESAKPKLFTRMRNLLKAESVFSMMSGAVVLAIAANAYELLCTAGFPMVFTKVLTLRELPKAEYYLYLVFYNLIYIVPLGIIVIAVTATLGARKLTEWHGRVLKLVSGLMMFGLGIILAVKPALLNNVLSAIGLLLMAIALTGIAVILTHKYRPEWTRE